MTRIAVAGGTGALAKTFVDVLSQAGHDLFVFSRSVKESPRPNIKYVKIDYDDIKAMVDVLEQNEIDTVISALAIHSESAAKNQQNLTLAADRASCTRRFVPSDYGHVETAENLELFPVFQLWRENADVLEKTKLQWTRVVNGFFMDYYAMPHIKTHLARYIWGLDVENKRAAIPVNGEAKITMTYTYDMARFIARLLEEDEWPRISAISGQDFTFNELLAWAEEARGEKFDVTYDSLDKLQKGESTELMAFPDPIYSAMTAAFGVIAERGELLVPAERLNQRFPDIKPLTAKDMIEKYWKH